MPGYLSCLFEFSYDTAVTGTTHLHLGEQAGHGGLLVGLADSLRSRQDRQHAAGQRSGSSVAQAEGRKLTRPPWAF